MTYRIAYGTETETLEDPDQLVLVDLPYWCADFDNDRLVHEIEARLAAGALKLQPMVGLNDVTLAMIRVLEDEGLGHIVDRITQAVADRLLDQSSL